VASCVFLLVSASFGIVIAQTVCEEEIGKDDLRPSCY
jgi:hypothetical protein